jgi:hypothetical protein
MGVEAACGAARRQSPAAIRIAPVFDLLREGLEAGFGNAA